MTKVSVALLTYNHERYIAQALESVLSQQLESSFEIVVGDDASTDGTREIILGFQRWHADRIRTIFPDRNLGSHGNRMWRQVLEACRGEYIALLDGDDYWTSPEKLQNQVAFLDTHLECVACFHNVTAFNDEDPSECWDCARSGQQPVLELPDLLLENLVPTCAAVFRRNVMGRLPDWWESTWMADWALHILNARRGKVGYIDVKLGAYRIHPRGMSTSKSYTEFLQERLKLYEYLRVELDDTYGGLIEDAIGRSHGELALQRTDRRALFERIRGTAREVLPPAAAVIAVTNGDDELTRSGASHWWHFPAAEDKQEEVLFVRAPQGVQAVSWICADRAYEFRLYSAAAPKTLLAMIRIRGSAGGMLEVAPAEAAVTGLHTTTVTWRAGDDPETRVLVSQNAGPEKIFALGASGREPAPCISPGETYDFVLTGAAEVPLAHVRLMRGEKAFVAAEAPRFRPGIRLGGTTTIVWSTGDGTDGEVYLLVVPLHYPADGRDAITQLEALRKDRGEYLLFPSTAFWWLQHYPEFREHLERTSRCIVSDQDCVIFDLRSDHGQQDVTCPKRSS